jgi:hypothetical protein
MKYQNITLSLPKELLMNIKHIAVDRQTSVSGLLIKTLEDIINNENIYHNARQHHLDILEKGVDLGTNGNIGWKRDELHDH